MPNTTAMKKLFANFIKKTPTCWLWVGKHDPKGYGLSFKEVRKLTKQQRAHRAAWVLFKGPIPKDKPHVLHHCDNPACIRWTGKKHLFVGTHQDNMADRDAKGRLQHATGEAHCNSTMTDATARKVYRLFKTGHHTQRALAVEFGTTRSYITSLVNCTGRFEFLKG